TITLSQEHFAEQILHRFRMADAKPVATPLDANAKLNKATPEDTIVNITLYRKIVGSLMYLMLGTRPDLAATISIISQFSAQPTNQHLQAAYRTLRYLRGTTKHKLHLGGSQHSNEISLHGYSDSSWGDDPDTRKSTSGYVFFLSGGPVSWASKKQHTIALS